MVYNTLAPREAIDATIKSLNEKHIEALLVETGSDALEKIKDFIPVGASVMNGSSRTLEQIGFVDYLKSGT
ncbi:MAG: LUD domain-containing protein, partial [Patescibacteria group bacterium]